MFVIVLESNEDQTIKNLVLKNKHNIIKYMNFYTYCSEIGVDSEKHFSNTFLEYDVFHYIEFEPKYTRIYNAKKGESFICIFMRNSAGSWESLNIFLANKTNISELPYYCKGSIDFPS